MSIPSALTGQRSGFLYAIAAPQASQTLQENWTKLAALSPLPKEQCLPPTGMSVSNFRYEKYVCFLIIFPRPRVTGEAYFGFIVAGPTDDWSPETRAKVPVCYYLLERSSSDSPTILQWRPTDTKGEETFDSLGGGPSPNDPRLFVELILTRFYGLKPHA
jgi:hypothetical protein